MPTPILQSLAHEHITTMATASNPSLKSSRTLLWLVGIGFFMQILDSTIVNTALPSMAHDFGVSSMEMRWVVVSYMITNATIIPASGWLADRFGTRNIFSLAIVLFVLGSAWCAYAPSLNMLILGRVIQGSGAAMLAPVGRLAVLRTFPKKEFLGAMNFVIIPGLIGQVIGPTLGGILTQVASWHWVFLINIPIGVVGAVATIIAMPDKRADLPKPFDWTGYSFLAVAMVTLLLGFDGFSGLGFSPSFIAALFVLGLISSYGYWYHSQHSSAPLFTPKLFSVASFKIGILGNIFARMGSGAIPFLIPVFLQAGLGYSPIRAGLLMLPIAISAIAIKRFTLYSLNRFGYRAILVANTLALGVIIASCALITAEQPIILLVIQLSLLGAANSTQFTAMNSVTLKDMESHNASSGNTLLSMTQMLSIGLAVTLASTLIALFESYFSTTANANSLLAYHYTFIIIGFLMACSALIFNKLESKEEATQSSFAE